MQPRILVISNPYDAEVLRSALAEAGYAPEISDGGDAPAERIEAERPEAVVMSLRLARADGRELLGQLREGTYGASVPVLLIAEPTDETTTLSDAVSLGADQLVLRPLEPSVLLSKIEALFDDQQGTPAGVARTAPRESAPGTPPAGTPPVEPSSPRVDRDPTATPDPTGDEAVFGTPATPGAATQALHSQLQQEIDEADRRLFPEATDRYRLLDGEDALEPIDSLEQIDLHAVGVDTFVGDQSTTVPGRSSTAVDTVQRAAHAVLSEPAGGSLVPLAGELSSLDLPQLLEQARRAGFTGRLTLARDQAEKAIFFDDGYPVFAVSNEAYDRLGDLLHREGKLSHEQYELCQKTMAGGGRRMGAVLVDHGLIKSTELFPLVRRQVSEIIYSVFSWRDGSYELRPEGSLPSERIRLEVHPAALIVEGIRRKYGLDRLFEAIGPAETAVAIGEMPVDALERAGFTEQEREVVAMLDGTRSIGEVANAGPLDALQVYQVVYALMVLGPASLRGLAASVARSGPDAAARELKIDCQRLQTKYAQVLEGDYFSLLGLGRDASAHEVRRAYERVRSEFDASRFAPRVAEEYRAKLIEIVEVIDEAFRILGDDVLREAYRETL